ncbi:MAG: hypothetical protein EBQ73_15045 [Gammaproteobacteria bacterium]|nr:hypothetical protein [Gammaproteobacteria bacterium]
MTQKMIVPALLAITLLTLGSSGHAADGALRLPNHVQSTAISQAVKLGPMASKDRLTLSVVLRLKDPLGLEQRVGRLSNPKDPDYGQYLTPGTFADQFAPGANEVAQVTDFFKEQGFDVEEVASNRLLVVVSAPALVIEKAFDLRLDRYQGETGTFIANDRAPLVPAALSPLILTIQGLDDVHHRISRSTLGDASSEPGLGPKEMASLHGLETLAIPSGQTLALIEMAEVAFDDIDQYQSAFGLPKTPVESRRLGDFRTIDANHRLLASGDVELALGTAPGLGRILLYQSQNTDAGMLLGMNRAAAEGLAQVVVSPQGLPEADLLKDCGGCSQFLEAESQILQEMAAQGQSFVAAAGHVDAGNPSKISSSASVDDPAAQPYAMAVGGTQGRPLGLEVVLNDGHGLASGGGVSGFWPLPMNQQGVLTAISQSQRNVPDLALHADPEAGYAIVAEGAWKKVGGTGSSAILWGAITARLNAEREAHQLPPLGYGNPALWQLNQDKGPDSGLKDITHGGNGRYVAGLGYDNVSGWGAPEGHLLALALSGNTLAVKPYQARPKVIPTDKLVITATPSTTVVEQKVALSTIGGAGTGAVTYQITQQTPNLEVATLEPNLFKCVIRNKTNLVGRFSAGTCTVVAIKAADGTYPEQTSDPINITINKADQLKLVIATDPNPVPVGATTFLSTVGGSGIGKLNMKVVKRTGFALCQIFSGILWSYGGAGTCSVQAFKDGDNAYNSNTSKILLINTN